MKKSYLLLLLLPLGSAGNVHGMTMIPESVYNHFSSTTSSDVPHTKEHGRSQGWGAWFAECTTGAKTGELNGFTREGRKCAREAIKVLQEVNNPEEDNDSNEGKKLSLVGNFNKAAKSLTQATDKFIHWLEEKGTPTLEKFQEMAIYITLFFQVMIVYVVIHTFLKVIDHITNIFSRKHSRIASRPSSHCIA